jgi:D-hydroxyproline dehydrogenase subunit beta
MNEVMLPSCPRGEPVLSDTLPASADAVVIGAGMVGAATAAALAATGQRVLVVDGAGPLGGTTAAGEGNILVSDKLPGLELTLALRSAAGRAR